MEHKMKYRKVLLAFVFYLPLALYATPFDHIHLAADNALEAAQWYSRHFDGTPTRFRDSSDTSLPIDRAKFGDIFVIFYGRDPGPGSVGSGVDHISFSLSNVEEVFDAIIADGGKGLGELREFNGMTLGFVEDPWGTKIELIDDAALRGVHHIHLSSADPAATLDWYQNIFGGETAQFGGAVPGIHYGNIWLLAAQARADIAPTTGRSMDHIGWNFPDLDAAAVQMKAKGAVFAMEPRDYRGIKISFVEGPDDVRIEVVQP
jgi:catechol 2,3-dioxygenase-like lactoylglutathione lyase family enzyme